jgi:glucose-6-phosphate isomerase
MTTSMSSRRPVLTTLPAWQALEAHVEQVRDRHLRSLFAADPSRGERFAVEAAGLYLDYSKNHVTDDSVRLLVELARASGLRERIASMFRGDRINTTEERAVLHVALRAPRGETILLDGDNVVPHVHEVLDRMTESPIRCEMVAGADIRGGGYGRSSISESAVQILDRSWRTKR